MSFSYYNVPSRVPENKISKFIQIKTHFGFQEDYQTALNSVHCPYIYNVLSCPLARADRIQTGIQSVTFMKGQDFSFVYQFGYLRT